jgi:TonB family protein
MTAFSFLMGVALKSSAVLAAASLAAWLLRGSTAAVRHLVWMAAAAAVLALPLLSLALPAVRMPGGARLLEWVPNITFQANATAGAAASAQFAASAPLTTSTPAHPAVNWRLFPVLLWAAGALVGVAQIAVGARVIGRARRRAPAHPAQSESAELASAIGIGRAVEVLEAPPGAMPMSCGMFRPAVFLPADAAGWDADRRRAVLLHELAHVRRGDAGAHMVARLALALHWWNPLAWLAWRESLKACERAADDLVLLAGERASDYAGHLLEVARAMHARPPMASGALAMARRSQLEGRLLAILDPRVPRQAVARVSALAAALLAIAMVAPFAAMRAQEQPATPQDANAIVRSTTDVSVLDRAARRSVGQKQYDDARKLLEAGLALREKTAGRQSAEYSEGLAKLGDLARRQRHYGKAAGFYLQAVAAVDNKPAVARPLIELGVMALDKKDYPRALDYFTRAEAADPKQSGMALTWIAVTYERQDNAAQAETAFQQAMAAEDPASADAITTTELYAMFLKRLGRDAESDAVKTKARAIPAGVPVAQAGVGVLVPPQAGTEAKPPSSGVFRVGKGVSAPVLIHKREPEYSEDARVARYQGTAVLFVAIGTDGSPHDIRVVRSLGFGLDENAIDAVSDWKFQPGMKDGVPVTVAATIEVNFRLL